MGEEVRQAVQKARLEVNGRPRVGHTTQTPGLFEDTEELAHVGLEPLLAHVGRQLVEARSEIIDTVDAGTVTHVTMERASHLDERLAGDEMGGVAGLLPLHPITNRRGFFLAHADDGIDPLIVQTEIPDLDIGADPRLPLLESELLALPRLILAEVNHGTNQRDGCQPFMDELTRGDGALLSVDDVDVAVQDERLAVGREIELVGVALVERDDGNGAVEHDLLDLVDLARIQLFALVGRVDKQAAEALVVDRAEQDHVPRGGSVDPAIQDAKHGRNFLWVG